jgi:predicted transcriptional regulator
MDDGDALTRFRAWVAEVEASGKSRTQVAAQIDCSESALSRILAGKRGAGGSMAARIERATATWARGPIHAADWYAPIAASGTEG